MIKDKNTEMKNKVFCHFLNNVKSELLLNPFCDAGIPKNTLFCSSPNFSVVEVHGIVIFNFLIEVKTASLV
jgi:hypothetical protein